MADPVFSPDGKFMWTGTEWIPAPPSLDKTADTFSLNLKDSAMSGDINIIQNEKGGGVCETCKATNVKMFPCILCSTISCEICNNTARIYDSVFERRFDDSTADGPYCKTCKDKNIQEFKIRREIEEQRRIAEEKENEELAQRHIDQRRTKSTIASKNHDLRGKNEILIQLEERKTHTKRFWYSILLGLLLFPFIAPQMVAEDPSNESFLDDAGIITWTLVVLIDSLCCFYPMYLLMAKNAPEFDLADEINETKSQIQKIQNEIEILEYN